MVKMLHLFVIWRIDRERLLQFPAPDAFRALFDEGPVALFTPYQGRLGPLALADVYGHAHNARDITVLLPMRRIPSLERCLCHFYNGMHFLTGKRAAHVSPNLRHVAIYIIDGPPNDLARLEA